MSSKKMITCTRRIEFDAAHRIINHESKCKMLHGHRYVVEITFEAINGLDNLGRVIDFGNIKEIFGSFIDNKLDHNTILSIKDKELGDFIAKTTNQEIYYLKENPTAENIAKHLFEEVCPILFQEYQINIAKIKIFETPNCSVEIQ
jgi:6-pyruvoyltetrahydropterin/6-carboxytetrahydropterin synthase